MYRRPELLQQQLLQLRLLQQQQPLQQLQHLLLQHLLLQQLLSCLGTHSFCDGALPSRRTLRLDGHLPPLCS